MATLLLELGAAFAAIALAGSLARALGQSVIPFYILAGLVVNPFVLGTLGLPAIEDREVITVLAELGIVFLLFFLGLEFSFEQLLASGDRMTRVGLLDIVVNFPVGVGLGLALGWTPIEAVVLGGIVYISSSAVITKSLIDLGWIANAESEPVLGTLVFEDLAIAVYLALLAALLGGTADLGAALVDVAVVAGFFLALVLAVAVGGGWFERMLAIRSNELFVLRAVALAVLIAGAALAIGASEAVAAFFVGMGFSSTDHVHRLETLLVPLRDVFAAVFFFWIGLRTDPRLVVGVAVPLALAVVLTAPAKFVSGYYGGRLYDLDDRRSVRVACSLVTRGEFSLIIAALAATQGTGPVLTETVPAFAVGYVLVMSVLGTTLMDSAGTVERLLEPVLPG
ncbi:cation:proton antiporter [Halococcus saccharolyticus]|uniref:Potassium/proton antiporter membrane subunit, cpa2 family protein n=1 Tax=Halococcus saccharolyticus DSM 5350 TaxID=1227455 RepID=M0MAC3_9EURY|nr:cation:proton antiporter [Halococcus saccharolyticus]EMA42742.1 potassium/proton antiporter membrane subunit, cpa2 family protein [Halococcus saccharolyticus DSM 5350]